MKTQEHFDEDYLYVRKLLLMGKVRLADAKLWLAEKGTRTEHQLIKDKEVDLKNWGSGVAREEAYINKMLGVKKGREKDE